MKNKKTELDVDFIGGLGPLTIEEEKAISAFIKADKESRKQKVLQTLTNKRRTKNLI